MINVLSLFDGISCCHLALDRAGISVDKYYAAEIDKYAITITQANYPDTIQMGSVTEWQDWDINWSSIDLVTGGFPCQAWSVAGKQMGDKDERGALFWVMLDIMKKVLRANPRAKFLMENVKMKKEFEQYITHHTEAALGKVYKTLINSALVSAQNRQRYYWTNWIVTQPEDKGIVLADILEDGEVDRDKSYCIDANYHKGGNPEQYFNKARRQLVFNPAAIVGRRLNERGIVLSSALDADVPAHRNEYHIDEKHWKGTSVERYIEKGFRQVALTERRTEEAKQIRKEFREKYGRDFSPRRGKELVARSDGKMNCLTATYSIKEHTVIDEHLCYRKLTPTECEALQTVPRNYTAHVSNTQRYKCLGNAWTVDVIAHIFSHIESRMVLVEKQLDLFEGAA